MNKKAIVLPETLKIIIGVLCILLLIYLAFSLYSIFITKSKLAQARETLKEIVDEINGLEEGRETDYLVTGPKDWVIMYLDDCGNKERCIFACPKEHQSNSQECLKKGTKEPLKTKLSIGYYCVPYLEGEYQLKYIGCFETGIERINLLKSGEYVFIGKKEYFSIVKALDLALESKDSETGKTVNMLVEDYIKNRDENTKKKIKDDISNYFVSNNLEVRYRWELKLTSDKEEIKFGYELKRIETHTEGTFYEYWEHTFEKTKRFNDKEYTLRFSYMGYQK